MSQADEKAVLSQKVRALLGRPDRATDRTLTSIELAVSSAFEFGSTSIDSTHLLCGLMREGYGVAFHILDGLGLSTSAVERALRDSTRSSSPAPPQLDEDMTLALKEAWNVALSLRHNYIGTEHLLLSLVASPTRARELLTQFCINASIITTKIRTLIGVAS